MPPSKLEWLIHVPDFPNSLEKRTALRPQHLENLKPEVTSGNAVFGGATLERHPGDGESPCMNGSFMLVYAATEEEARSRVLDDVYAKNQVWDVANMEIWPFRCAVRVGM
ncbi:hypothetical protein BDV12DRAFT_177229 [Aspergillus spectabilis]